MSTRLVRYIEVSWRCTGYVVTGVFERVRSLMACLWRYAVISLKASWRCIRYFVYRYAVVPLTLVAGFICGRNVTTNDPYVTPSVWSRNGAQIDTEKYLHGYPGKADDPSLEDNYRFYANEIPSRPDGDLIETIHAEWWGQYEKLERHHGYIQWEQNVLYCSVRLFPIRERGVNGEAQELQLHEAKRICSDPVMHERVLKSYELMLDFYGMKLKDRNTGEIERADNWKERFHHLNHSSHNYLRITRILKCLGEMEYEYLKAPFLRFVLHEAIVEGTLDHTLDSCMNYWLQVLKDDQERADVKTLAAELQGTVKEL